MHAALWLPCFHLQAVLRRHGVPCQRPAGLLEGAAGAVQDQGVLREVNAAAERQEVYAGMTPPQAQARCPQLLFVYPEPAEEAEIQRELLACAADCTPYYEATLPGLCVLDLSKRRDLRGREETLAQRLQKELARRQLDVRVGMARQADLAMLAAQAAQPVLVLKEDAEATAFLHGLPLAALRPGMEVNQILSLWGINTLGQFIQLPRAEVAARLGAEGTLLWDMAAGGRERLLQLVRPAASFAAAMDLEHGIECLEPLLLRLKEALERLCLRLEDSWLVAASVRLRLRFADGSGHLADLRVAEPCRDVALLTRLLHTHLEGLKAAAPIVAFAVELQPIRPAGAQTDLFSQGLRDPNRFAETLAQIEALLGSGKAGKARLLPSRRLDAFGVTNYLMPVEPTLPQAETEQQGWLGHGLPLRLFRPAPEVQVKLQDEQPAEVHTRKSALMVRQSNGPWLLSGEWWNDQAWQHETWEVTADDGSVYQLTREGDRWVLDGVFG